MLKTVLTGALASTALLAAGGAQAHESGYGGGGYDSGRPAYASGGGGYAPYQRRGFPLLGARAGVTVLGVDLDADANLRIGASGWGHSRRGGYAPQQQAYAPPPPPEPIYAPQPYMQPSYGYSYGPSYGGCGC